MTESTPDTPDFDAAGKKLWSEVTTKWTLRPDELRVLEDACHEADLIDDLAAAAKGADKLVKGSMGQMVINPLISELRQHRTALRTLLSSLKLPDEAGSEGDSPRSVGARNAAQSRWGKTG